jgi:hypothetical protein
MGRVNDDYLYDGKGKQIGRMQGDYIYDGSGKQIGRMDGLRRMQKIIFFYFFI